MNRREFLRRAALVASGAIAADQLDLLERLTWRRRFWPGATFYQHRTFALGFDISREMIEDNLVYYPALLRTQSLAAFELDRYRGLYILPPTSLNA